VVIDPSVITGSLWQVAAKETVRRRGTHCRAGCGEGCDGRAGQLSNPVKDKLPSVGIVDAHQVEGVVGCGRRLIQGVQTSSSTGWRSTPSAALCPLR
jgi:hypothetical protein